MEPLLRAVPTGCGSLDRLLGGGLPGGAVSLVYGEAETGKSSLAMQCAVGSARTGRKALFVDSDGAFSLRRLSQIAGYDFQEAAPMITLVRPNSFQEQARVMNQLEEYVAGGVGLVVVDTVTSLYRVELGGRRETFALNRELNRQIASLATCTKTRGAAALMTSQVRSVFREIGAEVEPVAARVLRFWSEVVIHLKNTARARVIMAVLEKHPTRKRPVSCLLRKEENGLREYSP